MNLLAGVGGLFCTFYVTFTGKLFTVWMKHYLTIIATPHQQAVDVDNIEFKLPFIIIFISF